VARPRNPVKRTGSHAGFHSLNLYQCCPRKFYYRFLLRWRPKHLASPLALGSAFHEAKAAWYMGKKYKASFDVGMNVLAESKLELDNLETYNSLVFRFEGLFSGWVGEFGENDHREFEYLAVEKELKVPVRNTGFIMARRPDAVVRSRHSGLVFIMETKTSGFSHRLTSEAVYYGDQATSYLWGVEKVMGVKPYAVQPDIAYWNKQSVDPNNRKFIRPDLVFRSEARIAEFEAFTGQLFSEITQKANAVKQGFDGPTLFPRNSYYCLSFSTPCEYAEICGTCHGKRCPSFLVKESRAKNLGALVADAIAIS